MHNNVHIFYYQLIIFIGDIMFNKINKNLLISIIIPLVVGIISGLISIGGVREYNTLIKRLRQLT